MEKPKFTETEKCQAGEQSQERALNVLTSIGLFIKNSSWEVKQATPATAVKFSMDCLKILEDLAPNFGDKIIDYSILKRHPFSQGNFLLPKAT
jgi:hypothetical protein